MLGCYDEDECVVANKTQIERQSNGTNPRKQPVMNERVGDFVRAYLEHTGLCRQHMADKTDASTCAVCHLKIRKGWALRCELCEDLVHYDDSRYAISCLIHTCHFMSNSYLSSLHACFIEFSDTLTAHAHTHTHTISNNIHCCQYVRYCIKYTHTRTDCAGAATKTWTGPFIAQNVWVLFDKMLQLRLIINYHLYFNYFTLSRKVLFSAGDASRFYLIHLCHSLYMCL